MSTPNKTINALYNNYLKGHVKDSWSELGKTRFIYQETGKHLEKNTDFFLNEKLCDLKLDDYKMFKIYRNDYIGIRRTKGHIFYQIICKSSAIVLRELLKKYGIESHIVVMFGTSEEIRHWLLLVKADGKQYFLTISVDLPYIKNNLETKMFGNSINYFRTGYINTKEIVDEDDYYIIKQGENRFVIKKEDFEYIKIEDDYEIELPGEHHYKEPLKFVHRAYNMPSGVDTKRSAKTVDGITFSFDEIDYVDLNDPSDKTLYNADCEIGNEHIYDSKDYLNPATLKNTYYMLKEKQSEIYKIYKDSLEIDDNLFKSNSDVTDKNVNDLCYAYDEYIANFLNEYHNANYFDRTNYLKKIVEINGYDTSDIDDSLKKLKKDNKGNNYGELINGILNLQSIMNSFREFVNVRDSLDKYEKDSKKYTHIAYQTKDKQYANMIFEYQKKARELAERYYELVSEISMQKLNPRLNRIACAFINNSKNEIHFLSDDNKDYVPLEYIYEKFILVIPTILDMNYKTNKTGLTTSFSLQNYTDQSVIIKSILRKLFCELKPENCLQNKYNPAYSPIENRIRVYPLKNRKTGEYAIGFRFWAAPNEDEISLIYFPYINQLREMDALVDNKDYLTVSLSVENALDVIESDEAYLANYR